MSIADKIRNIYLSKKNIKNKLIDLGSDINDDTVLADYYKKINEIRAQEKIFGDDDLEFAQYYYDTYIQWKAFYKSSLKIIDLSNIDIFTYHESYVHNYRYYSIWSCTDLTDYFYYCEEVEEIILPKDKEFIGILNSTFEGCKKLKQIKNIETLNTKHLYVSKRCFKDCISLEYLDLSGFKYFSPSYYLPFSSEMFANCVSLRYLDLSNYNLLDDNNQDYSIFANCRSIETLKLKYIEDDSFNYILKCLYVNGTPDNPYTGPCKIYYNPDSLYNPSYTIRQAQEEYPFYEFIPES